MFHSFACEGYCVEGGWKRVLSDFKFRHYLPTFTQRSKGCGSLIRVIRVIPKRS